MKMRGMTGKWNAMWHSSPPAGVVAEVVDDVLGPLVGLGQQHRVRVVRVDLLADPLEELVGARAGSRSWCPPRW